MTTNLPSTPVRPFALNQPGPGLVPLEPARTALMLGLDALFVKLAVELDAPEIIGPPLLPAAGLARLDYFRNFPQLGLAAGHFDDDAIDALAGGADVAAQPVTPTGYMLPSATCYGILLSVEGRDLEAEQRVSAVGRCFRNETEYDNLRRLWGFHMREVLYLGDAPGAVAHLETSRTWILELADRLGIPLTYAPANDPFYDRGGSRAKLMALDPVKYEFLATDGTAIASVNRHRNFFGERLGITFAGQAATTSCTAFGVERWVHAMELSHGTADRALDVVRDAHR
jgi:hypothetical protein